MSDKWITLAMDSPTNALGRIGEYKRTCDWILRWFKENAPLISWSILYPESWEDFSAMFSNGQLFYLHGEVVVNDRLLCVQYVAHDLDLKYTNMGKERYLGLILRGLVDDLAETLMRKG